MKNNGIAINGLIGGEVELLRGNDSFIVGTVEELYDVFASEFKRLPTVSEIEFANEFFSA